jgi:hypothetical protein
VSRPIEKGPQDEHVKRSLEETDPLLWLLRHRRQSTPDLEWMVDSRPSICQEVKGSGLSNDDPSVRDADYSGKWIGSG